MKIDQERLTRELEELAAISDFPAPAVTRVVFSETDLRARAYVKQLCLDAGLEVREDAVGNTFARWQGSDPSLPAVATGSHIDAIPNAGRYDGTVGVLGGLEAIRAIQAAGVRPQRPLELILFTSEEPTRFGIGCLGSRLLCGQLDASAGSSLRDSDGASLDQVRSRAGFTTPLETVRVARGHYHAFVELHIEQGPILEQKGIDVGVVTAIAAPASLRLTIEGQGGHAGAVLMPDRHDAFLAAADIALALEAAARATGSVDTVATSGICNVFPGAINSIPSRVELSADIRDIDGARRDSVLEKLRAACEEVSERRGVRVHTQLLNADPPAMCGEMVVGAIEASCNVQATPYLPMISRAYHDSLFMSFVAPAAMIFIPCRAGVSHRPDEYASPEAIAKGASILAGTLARLAMTA